MNKLINNGIIHFWEENKIIIILLIIILLLLIVVLMCIYDNIKRKDLEKQKQKLQKQELDKKRRRKINTSDRQYVLERDNYTCQICGISKQYLDNIQEGLGDYLLFEIDHIKSVANGGTGEKTNNLQCLCWRCNRKKGGYKTNKDVKNSIDYGIKYLKRR